MPKQYWGTLSNHINHLRPHCIPISMYVSNHKKLPENLTKGVRRMAEELDCAVQTVKLDMDELNEQGLIKKIYWRDKDKRKRCKYIYAGSKDFIVSEEVLDLLTKTEKQIYCIIKARPGFNRDEIADRIETFYSRSWLNALIRNLKKKGCIKEREDGTFWPALTPGTFMKPREEREPLAKPRVTLETGLSAKACGTKGKAKANPFLELTMQVYLDTLFVSTGIRTYARPSDYANFVKIFCFNESYMCHNSRRAWRAHNKYVYSKAVQSHQDFFIDFADYLNQVVFRNPRFLRTNKRPSVLKRFRRQLNELAHKYSYGPRCYPPAPDWETPWERAKRWKPYYV